MHGKFSGSFPGYTFYLQIYNWWVIFIQVGDI